MVGKAGEGVPRYPGLWARWCVYAVTVATVVWALVTMPSNPTALSMLELVGLTAAAAAGSLFPVGVGPVGLWRARKSFIAAPLVVFSLTGSVQVTVVAWAVAAIVSGVWIRRSRFTPGRMAFGASMVTIAATAAASAIAALEGTPLVVRGLVGIAIYNSAAHAVRVPVMYLALGGSLRRHLREWDLPERAGSELTGMVLGVAAVLLRDQSPAAMLLLALPYGATIAAGLQRLTLQHARGRERAMATFIRRLQAASSLEEIEALMIGVTCEVLDTPTARIGPPPRSAEMGVRWQSGWLVAEDRRGAPTFNRSYRRAEQAELEAIVSAASTAAETLRLLEQLEQLSTIDPLTHLPNRRGAAQAVDRITAEARRSGTIIAVVVLDIDDFKMVNDELGHKAGDDVLTAVAGRLRAASRANEVVARWGGEEFVAVATCDSAASGNRLGERLRAAASGPVRVDGAEVQVTLSAGISTWCPASGQMVDAAFERADEALYRAKRAGKGRTVGDAEVAIPSRDAI